MGSGVEKVVLGAWGLRSRVQGLGFRGWGFGFGVWGVGCKCVREASGLPESGFGSGIIVQMSGFGFRGLWCNHADATTGPIPSGGCQISGLVVWGVPRGMPRLGIALASALSRPPGLMVQGFRVLGFWILGV